MKIGLLLFLVITGSMSAQTFSEDLLLRHLNPVDDHHTHSTNESPAHSIKDVTWLIGHWKRTNNKPGFSGHEKWQQEGDMLTGMGITMRGKDTAYVEKLQIILKEGVLHYVADVPENKEPVYFRFTNVSDQGFRCENAANDFPKIIQYQRKGKNVLATISGGGKTVDYTFEPME